MELDIDYISHKFHCGLFLGTKYIHNQGYQITALGPTCVLACMCVCVCVYVCMRACAWVYVSMCALVSEREVGSMCELMSYYIPHMTECV